MGNGRIIWFQIEKGEHEEVMILSLLYRKDTPEGHKDIFRFSVSKFPKETANSKTLSIFKSKLF